MLASGSTRNDGPTTLHRKGIPNFLLQSIESLTTKEQVDQTYFGVYHRNNLTVCIAVDTVMSVHPGTTRYSWILDPIVIQRDLISM